MASSATDDFENDWTFVDREGKVDIEPRKNSVSYSKSPLTRDEVLISPSEVPAKDDSEGEAEFEVLSGFQCHSPPEEEQANSQDVQAETDEPCDAGNESKGDVELVPIQQNSCQCAAEDGIMIISNHYCLNEDLDAAGDAAIDKPLASECDHDCNQEVVLSSDISIDSADGWRELPQLSESGSFSFPSGSNGSEEDNDIEPIPEEDNSQDFVDLSHEVDPLEEMVESRCSVFSFDSDLFNPSDSDEDTDNEEDHSDITKVSENSDNDKEIDLDAMNVEETENHLTTADSKNGHLFYVDVPTLFVLLGVTTALGFSIGYGLSVYISSQALEVSGNIKRPGPKTASLPLSSDPMEPLDEVSHGFLDQLMMWKLEDHLDPQREQEPENELGDLFDTKALHEKLQQKHFKLMSVHESVRQRLHMSKVMSWYWRLKYEEERSRKEGGSEWNKGLQEQLEHMEQLYLHEKHTADLWRRTNENMKLRRAVANGLKFDKYWKDFLHRWKKVKDRSPGINETRSLLHSTELCEKPEVKESLATTKAKKPEPNVQNRARMRDNTWRQFKNRWTKDSQLKGLKEETLSKSKKCAYKDSNERNDLSVLSGERSVTTISQQTNVAPLYSPLFMKSASDKPVGETTTEPECGEADKSVTCLTKDNEKRQDKNDGKQKLSIDFKEGFQFDNPLFPRSSTSFLFHDKTPPSFLKTDSRQKMKHSAEKVTPKETHLQMYWFSDGARELKKAVPRDVGVFARGEIKTDKKSFQKAGYQDIKSYRDVDRRKCAKTSVVQNYGPLKPGKISQQQLLTKQKQMFRNLSQHRGEEIRKHRVQRRELKKKEKEAKLRVAEADRYLSELKHERRGIEIEKRKLRRTWKVLKRDKKKFSLERERHKKDKKGLEKFMATLKEEKQKLKKLKGKVKKMKKLLAKEIKSLKLKKTSLDAETKKEVERFRSEIAQEKDKLRKQQRVLKSLKKAAKQEYKKWSRELRQMKKEKKRRREAEQEKRRKEAKKKRENIQRERLRKQEYESVVREQAKYDKEKRRKKGETGETMNERITTDNNMKQDEFEQQKGSTRNSYGEDFFRQQLEKVKEWLSNVREKTLDRPQKTYSQMENTVKQWLSNVHEKTLKQAEQFHWGTLFPPTIFTTHLHGEADNSEPDERVELHEKEFKYDKKSESDQESYRKNVDDTESEDNSEQSDWETEKQDIRKLMLGMEKRECERKENEKWEMAVRKSELTQISEDRALADFVNLTFDADLVKTLLKGLDKLERENKTASDDVRAADNGAFIIVSKESNDVKKKSPRKSKRPEDNRWIPQGPMEAEDSRMKSENWNQETPKGPIPPEGIRMSAEKWYEKRSKAVRSGEKKTRKRSHKGNTKGKVCTSDDSEERGSIPPDWVFQRARERAKDRADQRSVSWYDLRSQDRYFQRSADKHDTQFPSGDNWRQQSAPWYDQRAQDRYLQRSTDKHETQFPCGQNRKRNQDWFFERASDRAFQRANYLPWYFRRAEGRESQRREELDSWFLERGHDRDHLRDWMPQGPFMDEHR